LWPRYPNIAQHQHSEISNIALMDQQLPRAYFVKNDKKTKNMAAAQVPEAKSKVPNLCEPQPTITIYISKVESNVGEKIIREPLSGQASTNSTLATQSTPYPQPPKFTIHKNKICSHSPFFSAAFNSNFIEGTSQEMTLDVDLEAFGIIVNWMYTKDIVASNGEQPGLCTLARVWILADRFLIPKLQNQAMENMLSMSLQSKPTNQDFLEVCSIADQHAAGESRLVLLAAAVLTCTTDVFLDNFLHRIPRSIFVKAFQALKKEQKRGPGVPAISLSSLRVELMEDENE
jgi:hypothetical protein